MIHDGGKYTVKNKNLLYPELSFIVNGILFDVHNQIGGSVPEKYIQKSIAVGLKKKGLQFKEQYHVPIYFEGVAIGKYFLDFIIEEKIILELKRGRYVPKNIFDQVNKYLDALNLKLAIIGCFAQDCVVIKRIINHNEPQK